MTPTEFHAARKRLGMTQPQLAEALGMSTSRIADYERSSDRAPTIPRVVELALAAISLDRQAP